ncbi:YsnF/AvaK domain-containing protein [Altericroceibacterium xinjiangense]|uniref:YsnF/AvaK domain-containing protein n=1 Tax=Altericroceibacterium xinjiangense TaxID=762261 RepID=UPI000F7F1B0D|nr:YsnF/AvaK domain-containing protein [Altericroceibacterium xinjiangense]
MRHDRRFENLDTLDHYELEDESQDIRGMPLVSPEGERYGVIKDLLVDGSRDRVAAVRLQDGRVCAVEPLEIHENAVVYGPAAVEYANTGVTAGHVDKTPTAPVAKEGVVEEERIPLVEERIAVGKRMTGGGNIRVGTHVVSKKVERDVPLREEHVTVETRHLDRPVAATEANGLLRDQEVVMNESAEEVVVGKEAVVTDEVVVQKTANERMQHVEETVRKTELDAKGRTADKRVP